jgi:hypothetical protein
MDDANPAVLPTRAAVRATRVAITPIPDLAGRMENRLSWVGTGRSPTQLPTARLRRKRPIGCGKISWFPQHELAYKSTLYDPD